MKITLRDYRNAVKNALKRSLPHCMDIFPAGRKFEEPDYTAGLAIGLPQLLNTVQMRRLGLRFGGCYIHQSPKVSYLDGTQKITRELGDLLVLCRERIDATERFNAALLQLKMAGENKDVEIGQLRIYTEWPPFDFGKNVSSNPHYDISPKVAMQGALYSFVHLKDSLKFTVSSPDRLVIRNEVDNANGIQLQEFLADFVIGISGRAISPCRNHKADSWSHLIWDIVERLQNAVFKRKRISKDEKDRFAREHGSFFSYLLSDQWLCNSIRDVDSLLISRDEPYGISGLLMIDKEDHW